MKLSELRDQVNESEKNYKQRYDYLLNEITYKQYRDCFRPGIPIAELKLNSKDRYRQRQLELLKQYHADYLKLNELFNQCAELVNFDLDAQIPILLFRRIA